MQTWRLLLEAITVPTSHLVELVQEKLPTYFIDSADRILSPDKFCIMIFHSKTKKQTDNFLPAKTL